MVTDHSRISTTKALRLPEKVVDVVFALTVVLAISPYLSGVDLGFIKFPVVDPATARWLKYVGPLVALLLFVLLFAPIWPSRGGPRRLAAELLLEMRDRFHYALSRTDDRDRVEFPQAWRGLLFEGPGRSKSIENSNTLMMRIRSLLPKLGLSKKVVRRVSPQLDEVESILSTCSTLTSKIGKGPADEATWISLKENLQKGFALINGVFLDTGLNAELGAV